MHQTPKLGKGIGKFNFSNELTLIRLRLARERTFFLRVRIFMEQIKIDV